MSNETLPNALDSVGVSGSDLILAEVSPHDSMNAISSRRPSFMQAVIEPVVQIRHRKRKWCPSRYPSPPRAHKSSSPVELEGKAPPSDIAPGSTSHWRRTRRRRSTTTEHVGKIKTIFCKDPHQTDNIDLHEKAYQEHQNMHLENIIPGAPVIEGQNCCSYVHAFFDAVGEAGPSDYYTTKRWMKFQKHNYLSRNTTVTFFKCPAWTELHSQQDGMGSRSSSGLRRVAPRSNAVRNHRQESLQIAGMRSKQPHDTHCASTTRCTRPYSPNTIVSIPRTGPSSPDLATPWPSRSPNEEEVLPVSSNASPQQSLSLSPPATPFGTSSRRNLHLAKGKEIDLEYIYRTGDESLRG
ncbi:hypothetical protein DE146DRAFT_645187 [Phaeosphaeria sp. MPI-PUGE-AT-0046c]|nr:hypothetical protein DE146DRAFT_645187 [Phaeosphaeria sp. MPI-PUGE-AT-0046c]